jgi:hypothetical protein
MAVTLASILLLALIGGLAGGLAAWICAKLDLGWSARQRVFNSASIAPTLIATGSVCFALVMLTLGGNQRLTGSNQFLLQALTGILAALNGGMIAAYLVEHYSRQ